MLSESWRGLGSKFRVKRTMPGGWVWVLGFAAELPHPKPRLFRMITGTFTRSWTASSLECYRSHGGIQGLGFRGPCLEDGFGFRV